VFECSSLARSPESGEVSAIATSSPACHIAYNPITVKPNDRIAQLHGKTNDILRRILPVSQIFFVTDLYVFQSQLLAGHFHELF